MARIVTLLGTVGVALVALGALAAPSAHACDLVTSVVGSCPPEDEPEGGSSPPKEPAPETQQAPPAPHVVGQAAARLHELIDRDRAAAGLPALDRRDDVRALAEEHSMDMAGSGRIWHNDDYFTAENRRRLGARSLGENVALNGDVDDAHRRLMASEGHRANILSDRFTAVGIGVVRDTDGRYYVTQGFLEAAPTSAPGAGATTPTSTAAVGSAPGTSPAPESAPAADSGNAPVVVAEAPPPSAAEVRGAALRIPEDPPLGTAAAPAPPRSTTGWSPGSSGGVAGLGLAALLAAVGLAATFQRRALAPA